MKNIKLNEYWVNLYTNAEQSVEDFAVLFEFWKSGDATEVETQESYDKALSLLDDAEFKATLNEPEDELPAVLQINSGAGGTEPGLGRNASQNVSHVWRKAGVESHRA